MTFSVLMAVHGESDAGHLAEALASLEKQTLPATEVILVEDGPLNAELQSVLARYALRLPLQRVALPVNEGLAVALNRGLAYCRGEWVARMDSDDVSLPERFEVQMEFLRRNPDVDVCGAWVEERDQDMRRVQAIRRVPATHQAIDRFARHRNPISHSSCVFRRSSVLAVGGYPDFRRAQDYALWSLMLVRGYRFANLPVVLLWMRGGSGLYQRRGREYFAWERRLLTYQRDIGFLRPWDFFLNYGARLLVRSVGVPLRQAFYKWGR